MINFDHTINNVGVYDKGKLAIALISRESDCGRGRNYEQGEGGSDCITLISTRVHIFYIAKNLDGKSYFEWVFGIYMASS